MADKALQQGLTQAWHTITLEGDAEDVGAGDTVIVSEDHSATAEFCGNPMPSVVVTSGFLARLLASDAAGNAADGGRVVIELENTTAGTLTAEYEITRSGVLV